MSVRTPSLSGGVCAADGRLMPATPSAASMPNIQIDQILMVALLRISRGMPFTPVIDVLR
jgi:hypothetical protein